jgi:hypothetical protein
MKIVVGHHDSSEGRAALDRAVELAVERQAELHLVRLVALPKNEGQAAGYERARGDAERELRIDAEVRVQGKDAPPSFGSTPSAGSPAG